MCGLSGNHFADLYSPSILAKVAQVTIYLPDPIAKRLRAAARKARKSLSSYVADLLQPPRTQDSPWPDGFFDLAGSTTIEPADDPPPPEPPGL